MKAAYINDTYIIPEISANEAGIAPRCAELTKVKPYPNIHAAI
jgi:hypothetical protein